MFRNIMTPLRGQGLHYVARQAIKRQYMKKGKRIYETKHKFFDYLAKQLSTHNRVRLYRNNRLKDCITDYH